MSDSIPVRFFLDRDSGSVSEVRMNFMPTDDGEGVAVWFTCACDEFDEANWCRHTERVDEAFDEETGTLYGWLKDSDEDVPDPKDEVAFREYMLSHGMVETI